MEGLMNHVLHVAVQYHRLSKEIGPHFGVGHVSHLDKNKFEGRWKQIIDRNSNSFYTPFKSRINVQQSRRLVDITEKTKDNCNEDCKWTDGKTKCNFYQCKSYDSGLGCDNIVEQKELESDKNIYIKRRILHQ